MLFDAAVASNSDCPMLQLHSQPANHIYQSAADLNPFELHLRTYILPSDFIFA